MVKGIEGGWTACPIIVTNNQVINGTERSTVYIRKIVCPRGVRVFSKNNSLWRVEGEQSQTIVGFYGQVMPSELPLDPVLPLSLTRVLGCAVEARVMESFLANR